MILIVLLSLVIFCSSISGNDFHINNNLLTSVSIMILLTRAILLLFSLPIIEFLAEAIIVFYQYP